MRVLKPRKAPVEVEAGDGKGEPRGEFTDARGSLLVSASDSLATGGCPRPQHQMGERSTLRIRIASIAVTRRQITFSDDATVLDRLVRPSS